MTSYFLQKPTADLRVSIVIPVYNEAGHLAACLRAIATQTTLPYEVIVVDNNSTDATASIAQAFSFVQLVSEKRQGVVHARTTGFNAARGDIIGRIDADTVLSPEWIATVQRIFAQTSADAITGKVLYRGIACAAAVSRVDLLFRRHFDRVLGREIVLQGANMAVRRSAWQAVRANMCSRAGLHEDFDLAIHLNWGGYNVVFDESMVAEIGYRQAGSSWFDFLAYAATSPRTYKYHDLKSRRYMYKVVVLVAVLYPALTLMHRGYSNGERFLLRNLFGRAVGARVNPANFVE